MTYKKIKFKFFLLALATVVSMVGLNIHIGVTFYLSRIVLILFFILLIFNILIGRFFYLNKEIFNKFITIFLLIWLSQIISIIFSGRTEEGLRENFIYLNLMALFFMVVVCADSAKIILKAINFYLAIGLLQGALGIYQVIGGPLGWPSYQYFMNGIPTVNDRTTNGFFYSGEYSMFRAIGFFSSDVSHYAGYMAGILIIALSLIPERRNSIFLYLVIVFGSLGLLLSLSRSGIISFLVFGLTSLIFLFWRMKYISPKKFIRALIIITISILLLNFILLNFNIDYTNYMSVIGNRILDILNPSQNPNESMGEHIYTRFLGLDAFLSSPLIGVGLGVNANPWFSDYFQAGWAGSHSHHINVLGQAGLTGLILEWVLMWVVLSYMWKGLFISKVKSQERSLLAGLISAYITIIFGNFLYFYYLNDFVWFIMACGVMLSYYIIKDSKTLNCSSEGVMKVR